MTTAVLEEQMTEEKFKETLKQVVSENPERVYSSPEHQASTETGRCFYVHTDEKTGQPDAYGCLFGVVLGRLGIPMETVQEWETRPISHVLKDMFPGVFEPKTLWQMSDVQTYQDDGNTWGESYTMGTGESIEDVRIHQ